MSTKPPSLPSREPVVDSTTSHHDQTIPKAANLSTVLARRQLDAYKLPQSNEVSDIFATHSLSDSALEARVNAVVEDDDSFWAQYLKGNPLDYADVVENHLLQGIPEKYKGLVYLKTLDVKYQLSKERYNNMLNKSSFAQLPFGEEMKEIEAISVKNALNVVNYYLHEIVSEQSQKLQVMNSTNELNNNGPAEVFPYVILAAKAVAEVLLLEIEMVYVFLKMYKMLVNVNFKELFYEISRSIEDLEPEKFGQIVKQGILVTDIVAKQVKELMSLGRVELFELMLFQGVGSLTRVFVQLYKAFILPEDGDNLAQSLLKPLFVERLSISESVKYEPDLIKYENEYYLLNVNLLTNNNYELLNSLEINQQLQKQIKALTVEIDNLKTTHEEIIQQSQEYEQEIVEKEKQHSELVAEHEELKLRFDRLTMKDNLDNTIQANREFGLRNQELEQQIEAMKKVIGEKRAKLGKYEGRGSERELESK